MFRTMINLLEKWLYLTKSFLINQSGFNNFRYTFNLKFYPQTDCVAMGEPTSSTKAEIYIQAHEPIAISTALHPLKIWEALVDDIYSILKRTHLQNFFHHMNNLHESIMFTMEEESNG